MNRTKMIYFLSAFVLIIGCFALNKSYSLFTQTIDDIDPIQSTIPIKDASLSIESITLGAGEEYLIKQTVTNNSVVPINYWINTDKIDNVKIANHTSLENNKTYGISSDSTSLDKESTKDIYLIVSNSEGTTDLTINFTLDYNYTTITPSAGTTSNISNLEDVETQVGLPYSNQPNTLTYKILENFTNSNLYTPSDSIPDNSNINIVSLLEDTDKLTYPIKVETPLNVPSPTEFTGMETAEVGLYSAEDDYGTSYYFRGKSTSNYVNFAGFTWRIVRINGDGSVRLILDGTLDKVSACDDTTICTTTAFNSMTNDNAYVGYMYGLAGTTTAQNRCLILKDGTVTDNISIEGYKTQNDCESNGGKWTTTEYEATHVNVGSSTIKTQLDLFYQKYLNVYNDYISDTIFCADKTLASSGIGGVTIQLGYGTGTDYKTYYAASGRLLYSSGTTSITNANPTLKCAEDADNTYSRYTVKGETTNKGIETNGDLIKPIALLSADELVLAGAWNSEEKVPNEAYYLYDAYANGTLSSFWWTMSPYYFRGSSASEFGSLVDTSSLRFSSVNNSTGNAGSRPVINLRSDLLWAGGDGTSGTGAYTVSLPEE